MTDAELEKVFTVDRLTDDQREAIAALFAGGRDLAKLINFICPESREKSLALTTLQNAIMWADTAVAIHWHTQ